MTITTPPSIDTLPPAPIKGAAGFSAAADAFVGALNPFGTQVNAAGVAAYQNALDAKSSADISSAAAALSGIQIWSAATNNYAVGDRVISPLALSNNTYPVYICKVATAGTHIDPYSDATRWTQYAPMGLLQGGQTYSTSVQLTAQSPYAITLTPTGAGLSVTMPDATLCSTGAKWQISNQGSYDIALRDSTGTALGFVRGGGTSVIALTSNSTAAGVWSCSGTEILGIVADLQGQLTTAGIATFRSYVQLSQDKHMFLWGANAGVLYACVYDCSTAAMGGIVAVRSTMSFAAAAKIDSGSVLVVSCDASTAMQAVVLSVSGTAITVNTAASATLASAMTGIGRLVPVSTSWVVEYSRTTGKVAAISVSGTTATIGTEQSPTSISGDVPPRVYATGSVARVVYSTSSSINCMPYTVAGSTMTPGTLASAASTTVATTDYKTMQLGGDIWALHTNGGNWVASVFRLSTTTEAVTSANIFSHGDFVASNLAYQYFDLAVVSASKVLFIARANAAGTSIGVNLLTNSNGTVTAGTALSYSVASQGAFSEVSLSNGYFGFYFNNYFSGSSLNNVAYIFDCSGVSPVRVKINQHYPRYVYSSGKDKYCNYGYSSGTAIISSKYGTVSLSTSSSIIGTEENQLISFDGFKRACSIPCEIRANQWFYRGADNKTAISIEAAEAYGGSGVNGFRFLIYQAV